jgi:two-component system sensor histidine kinase/response regulator
MSPSETKETTGNVLIVDDTPNNLRFLSSLLKEAGYTVRKVINGQLAIDAAQLILPDLILLDIVMPGMSGYEVCYLLKASDRTRHIPIIFLSALDEELDKVQAFQSGGVDYVTKPFQVVEVLARIETHLKLSRLQNQLQQQNLQLQQEMEYRTNAEAALQILNQGLEARIAERTAKLKAENEQLLSLNAELQRKLTQAQRLGEFRSQLLNTFSNTLHAPLSVIATVVERLKQQPERSQPDSRYVEMIAESSQQIHQALQDALVLEAQQPQFNPVALDLTQFCRAIVDQWQLSEHQHSFTFVSWGQPSGLIQVDQALLQQAFFHLLSNAVCYSPGKGSILFELAYAPNSAVFRIRDEGIGIPAEEVDKIFDRFYRASNADAVLGTAPSTDATPRAGLGLAIVKQAVDCHGGTISISSEVGKGTTVTVTLPLGSASAN